MHVSRDTAAVVRDGGVAVTFDCYIDVVTVAGDRLVDGVVDDFFE